MNDRPRLPRQLPINGILVNWKLAGRPVAEEANSQAISHKIF